MGVNWWELRGVERMEAMDGGDQVPSKEDDRETRRCCCSLVLSFRPPRPPFVDREGGKEEEERQFREMDRGAALFLLVKFKGPTRQPFGDAEGRGAVPYI